MFTHKFPLKFQNPQIQLIFATVYSTIFYMMEEAIIEKTVAALRRNHFEVFIATDKEDARRIFFNEIFPHLQVESVSWGDSETMKATGVLDELRKHPELAVINTFAPDMSRAQKIYWRRKALTADLFLSGSNAVTQKGQLVNLDMIGNRVGGIVFGTKQVVLFIGINKITEDLEAADPGRRRPFRDALSDDSRLLRQAGDCGTGRGDCTGQSDNPADSIR